MRSGWLQTQYQASLESHLHDLFPGHHILSNTKKQADIVNSNTGRLLEVDVWLPELNLCFEFQDFYHYKPAWYSQIPLDIVQQKDNIKRIKLINDLQTLTLIPCWWNGNTASLQATILFQRPDLKLKHNSLEIPANPPLIFYQENMNYHPLMLASFPDSEVTFGSWWVGEKWDGLRCFWDCTDQLLYSRNKSVIRLRIQKHSTFGNAVLDAELWCGRGFYEESQAIVFTSSKSTDTSYVRLLCFDEASFQAQTQPFERRYALILSHLKDENPIIINAPRFLCGSESELQDTLQCITEAGGEGVMLRKPISRYIPGRSDSLFKMKAPHMHSDQEALVVHVESDGALSMQLPNGTIISVDKSECRLHRQPVRGDIVSYSVDMSQNAIAQEPDNFESKIEVFRIRSDLSWNEVMHNAHGSANIATKNEMTLNTMIPNTNSNINTNMLHLRSWKVIEERRAYFDKFAASLGMDPLNPSFWYNVSPLELMQYDKGYKIIARKYGYKLSTTLPQLYPDIGLDRKQFKVNKQSWVDARARKARFEKFASSVGMDSLNPLFWYNVKPSELLRYDKAFNSLLKHYGGKLSTILIELYPNIGLHPKKFKALQLWKDQPARRLYFDQFAAHKGMDPLNPVFWYGVTTQELIQFNKGYKVIASDYGGKLSSILTQLYPNIGLQQSQFKGYVKRKAG